MCASMRRVRLNEHITTQSERKEALTDANKILQVSGQARMLEWSEEGTLLSITTLSATLATPRAADLSREKRKWSRLLKNLYLAASRVNEAGCTPAK
jgi:hypothetical protein